MSEFSESYHLQTTNQEEAIDLLRRSKRKGYVYPASNGWVTFVVEGSEFTPQDRIVEANNGTLVHYVYAEDHQWEFTLFQGREPICSYSCGWNDDDLLVDDEHLNLEALSLLTGQPAEQWEPIFYPTDIEQVLELPSAGQFAEKLGLKHYEWLSFDYVESDGPAEGVVVVGRNG